MTTIALTGGTGFIGRHVLAALTRRNALVRLLVRDPARVTSVDRNVELVPGSLEEPASLETLVAGSDAVVHCAGSVRGSTYEQFARVNVDGSATLTRIARAGGCKRFLLLSSLAAREPHLSPYAASKRKGEDALAAESGGMTWAALRPPAVYGPGDKEMLPLFRVMAHGIAPVFGSPTARFSLVFAADLADAAALWALQDSVPTGVFEIDDHRPEGYGWLDICQCVSGITGKPVRQLRIPATVLQLPAALNWLLGRYFGTQPMLTPGKIRELRHPDWVARPDPAFDTLGWQPQFDLARGLGATPGWFSG